MPSRARRRRSACIPSSGGFWTKLPEKGRIAIYDTSWYRRVLIDRFDGKVKKSELADAYESILSFEDQLTEDGMVIIKLFLAIDKKEQKKRFEKLLSSKETAWRVSEDDIRRNKEFDAYREMNEEMLAPHRHGSCSLAHRGGDGQAVCHR